MTQLLEFIVKYMGFLWKDARFKISDSVVGTSNGGDALLLVESQTMRLQFIRDKTQLFLYFQPTVGEKRWYSVDLIRRLFTGRQEESGLLDQSYAKFIEQNLDQIERLFSSEEWESTCSDLRKLKKQRAKELFG